jgi:hypothetical protein
MASSRDYEVCVALDIGTAYSSYAYSTRRNPADVVCREWGNTFGVLDYKTPTAVLWPMGKRKAEPCTHGKEAEETYLQADLSDVEKNYAFFESFKKHLADYQASGLITFSCAVYTVNITDVLVFIFDV